MVDVDILGLIENFKIGILHSGDRLDDGTLRVGRHYSTSQNVEAQTEGNSTNQTGHQISVTKCAELQSFISIGKLLHVDQRSQVRFPVLPDFLRSSGYETGSTQPRE
jgi:hypothetical protein